MRVVNNENISDTAESDQVLGVCFLVRIDHEDVRAARVTLDAVVPISGAPWQEGRDDDLVIRLLNRRVADDDLGVEHLEGTVRQF